MPNTRAIAALARLSRAEMTTLVAATTLSVAGVVATPLAIRAAQPDAAPVGEVVLAGDPPDHAKPVVETLERMLSGAAALIGVAGPTETSGASVALWHDDGADKGVLNAGEAIVLVHSRPLRAVQALVAEGEAEAPIDPRRLSGPEPARVFRTEFNASARVIATDVTAMAVAAEPEGGGTATLRLTLTWGGASPDDNGVDPIPARASTLTVRLPLVYGAARPGSNRKGHAP